jgi:hypothetical protein
VKKGEVTLYVKSIKTAVANESISAPALVWDSTSRSMQPGANPRVTQTRNFEQIVKYDFTLPEDQERTVQAVDKVASELGVDVKIIDVTKENAVRRAVQEEIRRIKTFPTFVTSSGEKIAGSLTEQNIRRLLQK